MKHIGRPYKYQLAIQRMDATAVYAPCSVADLALEVPEYQEEIAEVGEALFHQRVRMTMARYAQNHHFPAKGDGTVIRRGRHYLAWSGKRWQARLKQPS